MFGFPSKCLLGPTADRFQPLYSYGALAVKLGIPHTSLRTNGGAAEIIGDFPFMLSLVEAFVEFFSRIEE